MDKKGISFSWLGGISGYSIKGVKKKVRKDLIFIMI